MAVRISDIDALDPFKSDVATIVSGGWVDNVIPNKKRTRP
jgi:hypothetical protein